MSLLCDLGTIRNDPLSIAFVETQVFTRRIQQLDLEDELRDLQLSLRANPQAGRTDAGTGGMRKIRLSHAARNKGKRSGARAHYLFVASRQTIYLVFVYAKEELSSLTPTQKRQLADIAAKIKAEPTG